MRIAGSIRHMTIRNIEVPVQKMLGCGKESNGYSEYVCMNCGHDLRRIGFSCKSCFCLSCAKKYVDDFVSQVSSILHPGMVYRHIILTIPEQLRKAFYDNRHDDNLLSEFMRCGCECLEDAVGNVKQLSLKIGIIIVVQTHDRSGHFNPHLHIIMTNGGIHTETGRWHELRYFPYMIRNVDEITSPTMHHSFRPSLPNLQSQKF